MGNFRITIDCVGSHGVDRLKKNGEVVDFGTNSPDASAKAFTDALVAAGVSVVSATLEHWPGTDLTVADDLVTGIRTGQFH